MGACGENARLIVDDLKTSWYFRVWCLLWAVCAIVAFSALIILAHRSQQEIKEEEFQMWVENATEIPFPKFHFRIHTEADIPRVQNFTSKRCTHNGAFLTTTTCAPWRGINPSPETCFAVNTDGIVAENKWEDWQDLFINCEITTAGVDADKNLLIAWELEGENVGTYGGNSFASIWIAPNDKAWVMLEKALIQGGRKQPKWIEVWERTLLYHSTNASPNFYNVSTIIGTFRVNHIELKDPSIGWVGAANVGGFAFFVILIHTIVMSLFGICLDNDSKFLRGNDSGHRPL